MTSPQLQRQVVLLLPDTPTRPGTRWRGEKRVRDDDDDKVGDRLTPERAIDCDRQRVGGRMSKAERSARTAAGEYRNVQGVHGARAAG